ncbi:hypothetical protein [Burkholderia sp. BCC0322]|uniref:hypothetical protein n=1 Tax=unclassified Burkholderia TaxID=2613784 RepID=UPI00158AD197|nr:hypothetical protein [Burkholderia sp. BCC0322]
MIHIHEHHEYRSRATMAWSAQRDGASRIEWEARDQFAGYCLDAVFLIPAGSVQRIEPKDHEPFAASTYAHRR